MNVEQVACRDDPRLSPYRNLNQTNLTRGSGLFVVEGPLLVERLLASRFEVASLLVDERFLDSLPGSVPAEATVFVLPPGGIEQVIGFNFHRGMLACGRRRTSPNLDDLLAAVPPGKPQTLVVAVDVQDPGNLGGLLRNCAAFGVDAVLLSPHCADPFSRRVLRVSMGAALKLNIGESRNIVSDLARLREQGITLVATVLDGAAESLESVQRPERLAILLGNEAHGLSSEISNLCHRRLTLPMPAGVDSLNVSVASGIFLYHLMRVAALE